MSGLEQTVQRGEAAEQRVDVARVAHVVAMVGHGGHRDRVQPDRVHAEPAEVVEPFGDPVQVTDAVPVGVSKRTWYTW